MIYFDHAASTPMDDGALQLLCTNLKNDFANPAAKHKLGLSLNKKIDSARAQILEIFGLKNFDVIFTSSATEANNTVIKNYSSKDKILFSLSDHPSVTATCEGSYSLKSNEDFIEKINEETELVVLTLVNAQNGQICKVQEIAQAIKDKHPKIKIHLDAAQAAFKIKFDFDTNLIDSICIASHKIGGPKGISALFIKKNLKLKPLLCGGGHELGLRSSTPSSPLIESMLLACFNAKNNFDKNYNNALIIKNFIKTELIKLHKNISFPFEEDSHLSLSPYILCMQFLGISSDIILRHLEMKDIYISSTTACSSKMSGYNPILEGLGISESRHKNILRISFGFVSTKQEAEEFIGQFKQLLKEISFLVK